MRHDELYAHKITALRAGVDVAVREGDDVNGISIRLSLPRLSTDISKLRIIWTVNTEPAPDQFDDEIQISVGRHSMGVVRIYWS
jgi:hypothetical protein